MSAPSRIVATAALSDTYEATTANAVVYRTVALTGALDAAGR